MTVSSWGRLRTCEIENSEVMELIPPFCYFSFLCGDERMTYSDMMMLAMMSVKKNDSFCLFDQ